MCMCVTNAVLLPAFIYLYAFLRIETFSGCYGVVRDRFAIDLGCIFWNCKSCDRDFQLGFGIDVWSKVYNMFAIVFFGNKSYGRCENYVFGGKTVDFVGKSQFFFYQCKFFLYKELVQK